VERNAQRVELIETALKGLQCTTGLAAKMIKLDPQIDVWTSHVARFPPAPPSNGTLSSPTGFLVGRHGASQASVAALTSKFGLGRAPAGTSRVGAGSGMVAAKQAHAKHRAKVADQR